MVAELGDAYLVLARAYDELGELDSADRAYGTAIDLLRRQRGWYRELSKAYRWYGKFLRRTRPHRGGDGDAGAGRRHQPAAAGDAGALADGVRPRCSAQAQSSIGVSALSPAYS